jgi:stage II sporulation protein D
MMKPILLAIVILSAAACTTVAPPPVPPAGPPVAPEALEAWSGETPLPDPPRIRVGLGSDLPEMTFPRIDGGYVLLPDPGSPLFTHRGFTLSAPLAGAAIRHGVQVAAFSDRAGAEALQRRLAADEVSSRIITAAGSGLLLVLAGDFATSQEASGLREALLARGYPSDLFVTRLPSEEGFEHELRFEDDENQSRVFRTRNLLVFAVDGGVPILGHRYRGGASVFINDRGMLNAINVLNLEHYVQGVVPKELGPRVYDELEAQKAQALAARTYAVRRMRDFEREGYDICPTPACQVYEGLRAEEPLSNQAVRETAGQVLLWQGQPIDALYTSTCGGETSDVSTMFPGRDDPWLRHARCVELELAHIHGRRESPVLQPIELDAALFRATTGIEEEERWTSAAAERAVREAARLAGVTPGRISATSTGRGSLLAMLGEALHFAALQRPILLPEDRHYFFPQGDRQTIPFLAAAFINKYQIGPAQPLDEASLGRMMPRDEFHAILRGWLQTQRASSEVRGKIETLEGRRISLKIEGASRQYTLPGGIPVYREISGRAREHSTVPVMIGDRARVVQTRSGRVAALIVEANYDGAAYDRTSSYSSWIRSYTAGELTESIRRRQPIESVADLEIVNVDAANRISELIVRTEAGREVTLRGLPVRWSLNVPDNLFSLVRSTDPDGAKRFTFYGKGWGHGTGMCQVGAYGMAFRGSSVEEIVKHYYRGVEIGRIPE